MKKRVFEIIQIGSKKDIPSTVFDLFITAVIFLNLSATVLLPLKNPFHINPY